MARDKAGLAMARMLNGEIATPELLAIVTGLSASDVQLRADSAADSIGGYDNAKGMTFAERADLLSEYGDSADPDVIAFLNTLHQP